MFNVVHLLTEKFIEQLTDGYRQAFGHVAPDYSDLINETADQVIGLIAQSDSLYHNIEHTIQVTLVGQCILLGKLQEDNDVTPRIWLNFIAALLCHDIGYVRSLAPAASKPELSVTGRDNNLASDAVLMPYHIDRGKKFVEEKLGQNEGIDVPLIQECIERTRFPVPKDSKYHVTYDYPGLVRGADLVGQIGDPRYLQKLPAVFFEFEESGYNRSTGYKQPGDLRRNYARFYEKFVEPYVEETLHYLSLTQTGQGVINNLKMNAEMANGRLAG